MSRQLTSQSTLENLKREAKRWLRDLRANVGDARARLERVNPNPPATPTLRDVQHALALEHGLSGWTELKSRVTSGPRAKETRSENLVARFLEFACPDHHIRGGTAHVIARNAAMRILKHHPEIRRAGLHTAIICGDLDEVERRLAERPEAAMEKDSSPGPGRSGAGESGDLFRDIGAKGWDPLVYLCFTRLPLESATENAVAIARLLLDCGADPNSFFMAGDSSYTPLVGVIGEGEEDRPPHPKRDELVRLLLERGANPFDMQVTYNTNFKGDILWLMKLIYEYSVKQGRAAEWEDPNWSMLDMGGYGSGARFLLAGAIQRNDLVLAEWLLSHGANPNAEPANDRRAFRRSLYEDAVRQGSVEIAELLVRYGATPTVVTLGGIEAFSAACFRLDRSTVREMIAQHPEYLGSAVPMLAAAKRDRADVVEFLLDLGVSPGVEDRQRQRGLHIAGYSDSVSAAKVLLERGAEIDPVESNWGNTPLDCAVYSQSERMIDLLAPLSRDVWNLTFTGHLERLRKILADEPSLAKVSSSTYGSLLFWLPDDDARALETAKLLLANGADPSVRNSAGMIAAERARRRGLDDVADLLDSKTHSHE